MIAITIPHLRLRLRRPGRLLVDWRRRSAGGHAAGGADSEGEESPPGVIEYNGRDGGDISGCGDLRGECRRGGRLLCGREDCRPLKVPLREKQEKKEAKRSNV